MDDISNKEYLMEQYNTSVNLATRIQLHDRFSTNPTDWHRWLFDQINFVPDCRVLELGCGSGALWLKNQGRIAPDWHITLSDFSTGMLNDAQQNLVDCDASFQYAIVDAQTIPFADNVFDIVIANHMLYHVPDRTRAFAEIQRVLVPQGRFYAATGGREHLREIKQICEMAGIAVGGVFNVNETDFLLQNGADQMAPWFSDIDLKRFDSNLAVTEVEPLLAFILASIPSQNIDSSKLQNLQTLINQKLVKDGIVHITKETGLFAARTA